MNNYIQELINHYKSQGTTDENTDLLIKMLESGLIALPVTGTGKTPLSNQPNIQNEALGIPDSDFEYHIIPGNLSRRAEVALTQEYLVDLPSQIPTILDEHNFDFEFINYGDTELVYVYTTPKGKFTALVGQPIVPLGKVRLEYDNLKQLAEKNPQLVVAPSAYVTNGTREGYITPYIKQARCIATYANNYGAYVPEPFYRFEAYSPEDEYLISKVIIANLVRLYDQDKKLALADCKIGGGDFIMEREYDQVPHTEATTLEHMKLIAARKLINIEMKEYIKLLKSEFRRRTYYRTLLEKDPRILVNLKNRVPMSEQAIEDGITLGLSLRKNGSK